MDPCDIARIITDDIDWNASEDECFSNSDDDEIDESMRCDPLDIAEVRLCCFGFVSCVIRIFTSDF